MSYSINGREVSRDEWVVHIEGPDVGHLIVQGGYTFDHEYRGAVWRKGARGLDLDLDDILDPPPTDGSARTSHRSPHLTDRPAFVSRRANSFEADQHKRNEGRREKAHRRLREDFTDDGRPRADRLSSLQALIEFIEHELDRKAARAAEWSERIRLRLAVPICEAQVLFPTVAQEDRAEVRQWFDKIRLTWSDIAAGETIKPSISRLDGLREGAPFMPRAAWDATHDSVRYLLEMREPELVVAEDLEVRLLIAKLIRRSAALGEDFPDFGQPVPPPSRLLEVGEALHRLWARPMALSTDYKEHPFECLPDSLLGFAQWATDRLNDRARRPIDPESLARQLRGSEHWEKPGRGKRASPGAVKALAEGLHWDYRGWLRRFA